MIKSHGMRKHSMYLPEGGCSHASTKVSVPFMLDGVSDLQEERIEK